MTNNIDEFIAKLAAEAVAEDAYNHYAERDPYNAVRRENLRQYLTTMQARQPKVLLLGEAPGYQGCRRSGIPFTSDSIILAPPEGVPIFGTESGMQMSPEYDKPRKEPSATIVWNTIGQLGLLPLIWSAYPFHPHKKDKPLSNRAPRAGELAVGRGYLQSILAMFTLDAVVAVGNNADKSLTLMEVDHVKVRHPSHGGKADFVAGFEAVVNQYI